MTDSSCPKYDPEERYRITSDGGIDIFSQRFREFAELYEIVINDDSTYTLGPSGKQVFMRFGSEKSPKELSLTGQETEHISKVVEIFSRFGYNLERITDSS